MKTRMNINCIAIFICLTFFIWPIIVLGQNAQVNQASHDGPPVYAVDFSQISNAIPHKSPASTRGNPPYYEVAGKRYYVSQTSHNYHEIGYASWYGTKFHGKTTSSGEPYDMFAMTAANKTLPIPCYVKVTNLENGKKIVVKVNDRGPFHEQRIIDLSYAAAQKLDMLDRGTAYVQVDALEPAQYLAEHSAPEQKFSYLAANTQPVIIHQKEYKHFNNESSRQKVYLQIGTFQQKSQAKLFAQNLKTTLHEAVSVYEVKLRNNSIYRIKIGPLVDEIHGIDINHRLRDAGLSNGILLIS